MAQNKIPLLSDNFQEIYTAVHNGDNDKKAELVPNVWGTRIYYAKAGWGRFWRILFAIWGSCFGHSLKMRKLKQAMQKTEALFQHEKTQIEKTFETYESHLRDRFMEKPDNKKEFFRVRYDINNWNDKTLPFIRLLTKGENSKLNSLLTDFFPSSKEEKEVLPPFFNKEFSTTTAKFQPLIDIERLIAFPLPYSILKKFSLGIKLYDEEEKEAENFINLLNTHSKNISLHKLRKAFDLIIDFIKSEIINIKVQKPDVNWITMELAYRNCHIFSQEDPPHAKWRDSLKSGTSLLCNGKNYVLGQMLGTPKKFDKKHVYKIKGDPDKVIAIGNNKMILGIQSLMAKMLSWGIRPVNWIEVDTKGESALIEYLPHPLNTVQWSSKSPLSKGDAQRATPFIRQIEWSLKMRSTPLNFNVTNLRYSKEGILKSCKIPLKSPLFDFTQAENFVLECANGHSSVFKHILKESGFYAHKFTTYYRDLTDRAIKDDDVGAENLAVLSCYQIIEPNIISRGKALYKEVEETKKKICKYIFENYNVTYIQDIETWVKQSMEILFKEVGTVSILWPKFDERVINNLLKTNIEHIQKKSYCE